MILMSILKKYYGYVYYLTHNNDIQSFCVYINETNNDVHVYKCKEEENDEEDKDFQEYVASYNPVKIFIGKSPLNQQTIFSGGHGPYFDGNSILLKIDTNNYIFIGTEIYSFTTEHEIVSFFSPVGNNDVPYPFAIDTEKNYYFLNDEYAVMKIDDVSKCSDPYKYLYSVINNIGETENIEWLYTGTGDEKKYHMSSTPRPDYKYDRLISRDGGPIIIEYKDQTKKELSKEEYVELLTNYNQKVGLGLISNIVIIYKRN